MNNKKRKILENIAKISKKTAKLAEGKQSLFMLYEPKKPKKNKE